VRINFHQTPVVDDDIMILNICDNQSENMVEILFCHFILCSYMKRKIFTVRTSALWKATYATFRVGSLFPSIHVATAIVIDIDIDIAILFYSILNICIHI
jgi:hypothetical protein